MYKSEQTCKVACPFLIRHSKYSITCEGVLSCEIASRFTTEQEKEKHMNEVCSCYPNSCTIRTILEKKYQN